MTYNHISEILTPTITTGINNVDFLTTTVATSPYLSNTLKSSTGGTWWYFSTPINLLPGVYTFYYQESGGSWVWTLLLHRIQPGLRRSATAGIGRDCVDEPGRDQHRLDVDRVH